MEICRYVLPSYIAFYVLVALNVVLCSRLMHAFSQTLHHFSLQYAIKWGGRRNLAGEFRCPFETLNSGYFHVLI